LGILKNDEEQFKRLYWRTVGETAGGGRKGTGGEVFVRGGPHIPATEVGHDRKGITPPYPFKKKQKKKEREGRVCGGLPVDQGRKRGDGFVPQN